MSTFFGKLVLDVLKWDILEFSKIRSDIIYYKY